VSARPRAGSQRHAVRSPPRSSDVSVNWLFSSIPAAGSAGNGHIVLLCGEAGMANRDCSRSCRTRRDQPHRLLRCQCSPLNAANNSALIQSSS
jgi:hypothetical protein